MTAVAQRAPPPTSALQGEDSAVITDPATSAPPPPDHPAPLTTLPPSGRISTRTRRRRAAAAATVPPAVGYGFGPGGAPRPSVRRGTTPARAPRPRPPAPVVMAPVPAASSVPTVPIPSDRDRAEPVGTPPIRAPLPTDAPAVTTTDLDALGAASEFQFDGSAARYSHADWAREQQVEPAYNAAMRKFWQPVFCRFSLPTSALPFRRSRSWLTKAACTPPTPVSFYSFDSRPHPCVGYATPGGSHGLFIER